MKGGFVDTIITIFKAVVGLIVAIISFHVFLWNLSHLKENTSLFSMIMNMSAFGWGVYYAFKQFKMLSKIEDL